jgi:hypothetical protein
MIPGTQPPGANGAGNGRVTNIQRWELLRDEQTGAGIPRPSRWHSRDDTSAVIALVDPFLPRDAGFRPNVNLVVERPHGALADLDSFTNRSLQTMRLGLTDLYLIDLAPIDVGGYPGCHVTSVYRSGIYALALEQWWTIVAGLGTTLSASCAVEDYARMAPVFEAVAAGLIPATAGAGT